MHICAARMLTSTKIAQGTSRGREDQELVAGEVELSLLHIRIVQLILFAAGRRKG